MKRMILLAAVVLSGLVAFASCSEKNKPDTDGPAKENVNEKENSEALVAEASRAAQSEEDLALEKEEEKADGEQLDEEDQMPMPEMTFHDMTLNDLNGTPRKLSDWVGHGNYVLLDFWASWCGPCRMEMPNVVANYAKYHESGFEIVGISFDQEAQPWKQAVANMKMTWPQLSDLGGWESAAVELYKVYGIPASILFDGSGKAVAINLRGEALGEKLKEIYGF